MTTILQINSSLHGDDAQSSRLASEFVAALGGTRERKGSTSTSGRPVVVRDLSVAPVPHLTAERLTALATHAAERTDVEFVYAEGLALGADERSAAVADAVARIGQLAA
jgi:FMN-dependent NADH-azoreductase